MEFLTIDTKVADHIMDHHVFHMFEGEPHSNVKEKTTTDISVTGQVKNENLQSPFTEVCLTNNFTFKSKYRFSKLLHN